MALSISQAKKLINNPNLSDKEVEQILSACRNMVGILFEKWQEDRKSQLLQTLTKNENEKRPEN